MYIFTAYLISVFKSAKTTTRLAKTEVKENKRLRDRAENARWNIEEAEEEENNNWEMWK